MSGRNITYSRLCFLMCHTEGQKGLWGVFRILISRPQMTPGPLPCNRTSTYMFSIAKVLHIHIDNII